MATPRFPAFVSCGRANARPLLFDIANVSITAPACAENTGKPGLFSPSGGAGCYYAPAMLEGSRDACRQTFRSASVTRPVVVPTFAPGSGSQLPELIVIFAADGILPAVHPRTTKARQ
jgi:hypothetical protein